MVDTAVAAPVERNLVRQDRPIVHPFAEVSRRRSGLWDRRQDPLSLEGQMEGAVPHLAAGHLAR